MAPEEVYISSVPNVKEGEGEEQWIKKSSLKAWRLVLPQKKKKKRKKKKQLPIMMWRVAG